MQLSWSVGGGEPARTYRQLRIQHPSRCVASPRSESFVSEGCSGFEMRRFCYAAILLPNAVSGPICAGRIGSAGAVQVYCLFGFTQTGCTEMFVDTYQFFAIFYSLFISLLCFFRFSPSPSFPCLSSAFFHVDMNAMDLVLGPNFVHRLLSIVYSDVFSDTLMSRAVQGLKEEWMK